MACNEKTLAEIDNAAFIDLEELASKEKFMDLHMVLERPRYLTRGLELALSIYNQLVSMYRRDVMATRSVKKAHVEAVDCVVNMFHVEYNRIAIETQEVMANKVKDSIQHGQQYDETTEDIVAEQAMDAILEDTTGASLIKESIRASNDKNKIVKGELTIAEAMKTSKSSEQVIGIIRYKDLSKHGCR